MTVIDWLNRTALTALGAPTDAFATTICAERYLGGVPAEVRDRVRRPDLYRLTDDEACRSSRTGCVTGSTRAGG